VERETRHLFGRLEGTELAATLIADWAVLCLEEGLDTPSLCIAAGLERTTNEFEAQDYLARACRELGIVLLEGAQAMESAVGAIMLDLLEGGLDARTATNMIWRMSFKPGSPRDLQVWSGLDDDFAEMDQFNYSLDELHEDALRLAREWLARHPLAPIQVVA
jgi:hypothetical protein